MRPLNHLNMTRENKENRENRETINNYTIDKAEILKSWGIDSTGMTQEQMDEEISKKMREKIANGEKE